MKKKLFLFFCFSIAINPIRAVDYDEKHFSEINNLINESFQKYGVSADYKAQFIADSKQPQKLENSKNNNNQQILNNPLIRQQTMCIATIGNTKSQINFKGNMFIDLFEVSIKNK